MKSLLKISLWKHSLLNQIKNGIPIGHKSINLSKKKYWHPLMSPFLGAIRNKTAILTNSLARKSLLRAFYLIALVVKSGGNILIVNTNPEYFTLSKNISILTLGNTSNQFQNSISKNFKNLNASNISYCSFKWVGGTLTNWKQISKSVLTFAKFSQRCESFLYNHNINFPRYNKIKTCFQGLLTKKFNKTLLAFYEKPDLIFLVNPNENRNVIAEANKLHIPIVALVESNTNLHGISYPIPCNIYSMTFFYYCIKKILLFSLIPNSKKKAEVAQW